MGAIAMKHLGSYLVSLIIGGSLFISGCTTADIPDLKPTALQLSLFPGYYSQEILGGGLTELSIGPELDFEWRQPLERGKKISRGTIKVTGPREARAGRVRLEWIGRNAVSAKSPHGSALDVDEAGGSRMLTTGVDFMLRRQ